ncbi:squalene/phytoene synthase family protein [Brevundimonas sp. 2R-24]|uniref:Squalene/phytoene synthase family protein n=1 Tax=Peiella sedimenti TaxID=3061083 RepID=A0ABT8SIF9_9CAUL|nr:squalene/phytoene synthase family protein [Caulobacteraceae bacterium XZ-24]
MSGPREPVDLDAQVRTADPDRWLSSRFVAEADRRADLIALYAFEAELGAIPAKTSQPLLAEMRYAWWREHLDGVFSGDPRKGHPVLEALALAVSRRGLARAPFETMLDAWIDQAHGREADPSVLYGGLMDEAAKALGATAGRLDDGARLWGLIRSGEAKAADALRPSVNRSLKSLPAAAFPAVAHLALRDVTEPEAVKRLRLIWASLRGRI